MKYPHEMNTEEISKVFSALIDTSIQQELMEGNNPEAWILAYVYDSKLRKSLEDYQAKIEKANTLKDSFEIFINKKYSKSSPIKI